MHGHSREVEAWLREHPPGRQADVVFLADAVHDAVGGLDEAIKWNRLTFTAGGDWHHWLCAVAVGRREVALVFHHGASLDDPEGLLQGEGRDVRRVTSGRAAAAPRAVAALVRQAVVRQREALDAPR